MNGTSGIEPMRVDRSQTTIAPRWGLELARPAPRAALRLPWARGCQPGGLNGNDNDNDNDKDKDKDKDEDKETLLHRYWAAVCDAV